MDQLRDDVRAVYGSDIPEDVSSILERMSRDTRCEENGALIEISRAIIETKGERCTQERDLRGKLSDYVAVAIDKCFNFITTARAIFDYFKELYSDSASEVINIMWYFTAIIR